MWYFLSTFGRTFRGQRLNNLHSCSLITTVRKKSSWMLKNTRKISTFSERQTSFCTELSGEVPGKRENVISDRCCSSPSWWESFREWMWLGFTHKWMSLMTGREWYTIRWNAAPRGPSCYAVSAQDGLCTFIQPDKTLSSQNRISPKQRKEKASPCYYIFLCFLECHKLLTKVLSCFWNDFHLSWAGLMHRNRRGRCHAEKQVKAALFNQEEK